MDQVPIVEILELPILPLKDIVIYPHMVLPLFIGRKRSINAVNQVADKVGDEKYILLVAQKNLQQVNPAAEDLYEIGTVAKIVQSLTLPDNTIKLLVEGVRRGKIMQITDAEDYFLGEIGLFADEPAPVESKKFSVLIRSLINQFAQYIKFNKKIPHEIAASVAEISDISKMIDTIAAHLPIKVSSKQQILETIPYESRIEKLMEILEIEIEINQLDTKIRGQVKQQMDRRQREYYLTEQLQAIHKELGDDNLNELEKLTKLVLDVKMPKEIEDKALNEIRRLKIMSPMSQEATVCRNYVDWLVKVPWSKQTPIRRSLKQAEQILNNEHYGLEEVKERILEHLAVQNRSKKMSGSILCLVGPPGVGKTSLGLSIAHATQREFVRVALGGVRDESEIRGHRRTYIGALPGRIIQQMAKAGVRNPLILLDEIDKMGMDYRGDPASALLEVLDPEQNKHFNDHYLEVDYDLSNVMFVTTANSMDIPQALMDRLEVIHLSGYTEDEKLSIAQQYLLPKQLEKHSLKATDLNITAEALLEIIRYYTGEAGVRQLERKIAKICRKIVKSIAEKTMTLPIVIDTADIINYLKVRKYRFGELDSEDLVGQVNGLAWTAFGGDMLRIEATAVPGKGGIISTGTLGDVMKESVQAAVTVVRSRAKALAIPENFYECNDLHIHVPEGATPKDGPSAGITICTALVSALTNRAVKRDLAMTGEITLRGHVLPIGGLKEKLLAARRSGIKVVLIPNDNLPELSEIPEKIYSGLTIHPVKTIDQVFAFALEPV